MRFYELVRAEDLDSDMVKHLVSDRVLRNDTILKRSAGSDVAWRSAKHLLGLIADSEDFSDTRVNGYDSWLGKYDAASPLVDEDISCAEVDS